jgi:hypothetical protein
MKLIQELLNVFEDAEEDPIPPRIKRYMNENGISYPDVETLEDLKRAHAEALLRNDPDSEARGLSYALGMNGLSKDELRAIAKKDTEQPIPAPAPAPSASQATGTASVHHSSPWDADMIQGLPALFGPNTSPKTQYCIIHNYSYSGVGVWDHNITKFTTLQLCSDRNHVINWLKAHNVPIPTDAEFKSIGI